MRANFDVWLAFAWRPENDGQGYHNDANDPGGNTNKGVIQTTWDDAVRKGYVSGDLSSASDADLSLVLRLDCWQACQCDLLTKGVDIMVADMAMVAGSGAAAKCLQRLVGATPDGDIGPLTLNALAQFITTANSLQSVISGLLRADDEYYESLRQFRLWGHGWERRAQDCANLSENLIEAIA